MSLARVKNQDISMDKATAGIYKCSLSIYVDKLVQEAGGFGAVLKRYSGIYNLVRLKCEELRKKIGNDFHLSLVLNTCIFGIQPISIVKMIKTIEALSQKEGIFAEVDEEIINWIQTNRRQVIDIYNILNISEVNTVFISEGEENLLYKVAEVTSDKPENVNEIIKTALANWRLWLDFVREKEAEKLDANHYDSLYKSKISHYNQSSKLFANYHDENYIHNIKLSDIAKMRRYDILKSITNVLTIDDLKSEEIRKDVLANAPPTVRALTASLLAAKMKHQPLLKSFYNPFIIKINKSGDMWLEDGHLREVAARLLGNKDNEEVPAYIIFTEEISPINLTKSVNMQLATAGLEPFTKIPKSSIIKSIEARKIADLKAVKKSLGTKRIAESTPQLLAEGQQAELQGSIPGKGIKEASQSLGQATTALTNPPYIPTIDPAQIASNAVSQTGVAGTVLNNAKQASGAPLTIDRKIQQPMNTNILKILNQTNQTDKGSKRTFGQEAADDFVEKIKSSFKDMQSL